MLGYLGLYGELYRAIQSCTELFPAKQKKSAINDFQRLHPSSETNRKKTEFMFSQSEVQIR